jgi:hypothetical protein
MKDDYRSYMLRFRRIQNGASPTWIVIAQKAQTGEKFCFSGLDGLIQFLQAEFGCEQRKVIEPESGCQTAFQETEIQSERKVQ